MPQPKKGPRLGGSPAHHKLLVSNLATELIRHGKITTTLTRAKTVQPVAERMISFAKRGDVHARRQVLQVIRDRDVVHKLFADVGPAFADRDGGYTRVLKLGPRKGDAAPMALIELVEGVSVAGVGDLEEAPRRRWSLRRKKGGTLSTTARDRAEEQMAAVDAGEDLDEAISPTGEAAEAVPAGSLTERDLGTDQSGMGEDGVQADPAEVEARLAAQDAAEADAAEADEADAGEADTDSTPAEDDGAPDAQDKETP